MKTPSLNKTFRLLPALAHALVLAVLAGQAAHAAQLTNFFNSSLPSGTYDFLGSYWNTNSETTTPSVAFVAPGSITIGQNAGDFNGENLIITWDIAGTTKIITTAGTNITIGSTNVVVTFNGTQNNYIDAACTITVATGSTLIEADTHDQGLNFNNEAVTLAGGGTIIFATSIGGNSTALMTQNMPGGTVVLEQTNLSGTDYLLTGGYTLTSGALVFATATGAGGAFTNFAAGKLLTINGGSLDNTSGSPQSLYLGAGAYSIGGNFGFAGSSSLSLNTNAVALAKSVVVTNLSNTLTIGGVISGAGFGLTTTGPGTLALGGANTYTGATMVNGGTLALGGSASLSSGSAIGISNATFSLSAQLATTNSLGLTNALLVLTVPVNFTTNVAVGALNLGGTTNTINIAQLPPFTSYPTTIPLISYSNTLSLTNLVLGPLPASTGAPYAGHLTTNTAHLVTLVMTAGPAPARTLTWIGTDASDGGTTAWDVADSYNWTTNPVTIVPTTYNQLDFVRFDDSTITDGSPTPGQVQLTTELTPSLMTVSNNAVTYDFTGSGYLADPSPAAPMQLVKQGTGTMIMDNYSPNTYSGGTIISSGTFQVGNNNDTFGNLGAGAVVDNGTLSLQSGYNTITNPISGSGTIAQYGLGTVTLSGNLSGALSIVQYGAGTPDGSWDAGVTYDWQTNGVATFYNQYDLAIFKDVASPAQTNVSLTTTLTPFSLTVSNNASTYTLGLSSDPGSISGNTGLLKQGAGTLILDSPAANTFTGGITISGGILQVGNFDYNGNLPASPILDNSVLAYGRLDNVGLSTIISGSGAVVSGGGGTLQLAAPNTFTGPAIATNGSILQGGVAGAFGASNGMIVIASGSTLDPNGAGTLRPIIVAGTGVNGNGAIVNSGGPIYDSASSPVQMTPSITLTGDTTFSYPTRWDLGFPTGAPFPLSTGGHPYNLTMNGTGNNSYFEWREVQADPALGNITITAGYFGLTGASTLGSTNATLSILAYANTKFYANDGFNVTVNKPMVLNDEATIFNETGSNTISGGLVLTNSGGNLYCVIDVIANSLTLSGPLSGNGVLWMQTGAAPLILNGNASAFIGGVMVTSGSFSLNNTIGSGITNEPPTTLLGTGTANGYVDVYGKFIPGASNSVGTFTAAAGLTLESSSSPTLNLSANTGVGGSHNSLIAVTGNLTVNNTFIYINPLGALVNGTYTLMTYTGSLIGDFGNVQTVAASSYNLTLITNTPGLVQLGVTGAPVPATFAGPFTLSGSTLTLAGAGGTINGTYHVYSATNLTEATTNWTLIGNGSFDASGNFSFPATVSTNAAEFFFLEEP